MTLASGKSILHVTELDLGDALGTTGPFALLAAGVVLLPMTTSIAALQVRARDVLNPVTWVVMLYRMGASYWIAAVLFYGLYAAEHYGLSTLMAELNGIPIVGSWLALSLCYVTMAMRARLLGALCRPHVPR